MSGLDRAFFLCDAVTLARRLLGLRLVHRAPEGTAAGIIVETEAYTGKNDPAAHSFRGPQSGRTAIQYGPGGYAYVYLIYGLHSCMNVVAGPTGDPQAVLIRALAPAEGLALMAARRYGRAGEGLSRARQQGLCNGPGKLAQALGITRACNGLDLLEGPLALERPAQPLAFEIDASPRVNVGYAGAAAAWPYRFTLRGSPFLSRP